LGQIVHPYGLRLGIIHTWKSRWFADRKEYAKNILEDTKMRDYIKKNYRHAAIANIEIERAANKLRVIIATSRPGIMIGRRGQDIERLKEELERFSDKNIAIDITEIKNPAICAQLIAENIAFQLEKRIPFRRAMKRAVQLALDSGIEGVKICVAGRLDGAEIARDETIKVGKIPLHTFRANIDYGFAEAFTIYGTIGIKAWAYKGEVLEEKKAKTPHQTGGAESH